MKRRRSSFLVGGLIVALGGIATIAWAFAPRLALGAEAGLPTAPVVRGDLDITLNLNGELLTDKTVTLVPPPAGVSLRLTKILDTGTEVHAGDVIMEFDAADQEYTLETNRSQLLEAEQEIIKLKANADVTHAQAETELLTARFNLRRAEMDALTPQQFIGVNEAKIRALAVQENKRRLAELEAAMTTREAVDRAALASLEQRRNTAKVTADRARDIIGQLDVRSPIDGSVVVRENRDATQVFFMGMTLPEYRVGDTVPQGRVVVEIIDTSKVSIRARVNEQDRPNIAVGYAARVQANGRGGDWLPAKVDTVSGLASRQDSSSPVRRFDVSLKLTKPQPLLPGATVKIVVQGNTLKNVLHVPRQAVFERDSQTVVYAREGGRYVARQVKIVGRTESRVAITGVTEGIETALLDPMAQPQEKGAAKGALD